MVSFTTCQGIPVTVVNRIIIKTWNEIGSYYLSFEIISVGAFGLSPDSLLTLGLQFTGPSGAGQKTLN